ncbi:MAG: glycosyltransferase family 2 protein [Ignavibacteriales bacterium]
MSSPVAVIITCFNYGRFITQAVDSVLRQDMLVELIIVDDGSYDQATLAVLDNLRNQGITVYRQPNQGLSAARNTGISLTQAEFIVCLDADDMLKPEYCSTCYNAMQDRPEVGFIYTTTRVFGDRNKKWSNYSFSRLHLLWDNYIPYSAMFRRKVWEADGSYDSNPDIVYEDWDFFLTAIENGWEALHIDQELFMYRKHGVSLLTHANRKRKLAKTSLRDKHISLYRFSYIAALVRNEPWNLYRVIISKLKDILRGLPLER